MLDSLGLSIYTLAPAESTLTREDCVPPKHKLLLGVVLLIGLFSLGACATTPAIPVVSLTASDFAFAAPASVAGGLVRLSMTNSGKDNHHGQLLHLKPGVTQQQFQSTLQGALQAAQKEGEAALFRIFEVATLEGGVGAIAPGKQAQVIQNLAAGEYALVCFIPGADGIPHIAKGMVKALTVTAPPEKRPASPKADRAVELADFSFSGLPASVKAGKATWSVTNKGKEPHEMNILRPKGISVNQLKQALTSPPPAPGSAPAGPPPFEIVGGANAIMPGGSLWATIDLPKGDYALVCFIPSPANQFAPHLALGMFQPLSIS